MKVKNPFEECVPSAATSYCYSLWMTYQFVFRTTKPRRSKLGDFRAKSTQLNPREIEYVITVNENLNRWAFLITYLHEVAHLIAYRSGRQHVLPHGPIWQKAFQDIMRPVLNEAVFPQAILVPLLHYLRAPAASTGGHPALTHALRQVDTPLDGHQLLLEVPEGGVFRFLKKDYIRGSKRRTRVVCTEKSTGLKVSIWAHVWVEKC